MNDSSSTFVTPATHSIPRGGKFLTFALGREEYGLEILKVREIIGLMEITTVPRAKPHVRGVINLRGQVIAVIDLRSRFGMPAVEATDQTCIIVVEYMQGGAAVNTGIVVDSVSEVLDIPGEKIEPPSRLLESADARFILGMGKIGSAVKILLDVDAVMSDVPSAAEVPQAHAA